MLSKKAILKIFIAVCFIVAFITIKVYLNYGVKFQNVGMKILGDHDNKKRKIHKEQELTDTKRNNEDFDGRFTTGKVRRTSRPKDFSEESLDNTLYELHSKDNLERTKDSLLEAKASILSTKLAETKSRITENFEHLSTRKDLKSSLVPSAKHASSATRKTYVFTKRPAEKINIDHSIYFENIGNYSMYGDTNCPRNPDRMVLEKLFIKWASMAKESGIEFFLTCGTLLGAFRNGDVIPYDSDMDVLVDRRDFEKIKKYESRRSFTGYENDFHVAIQEDFYKPYDKRRRFTCQGKLTPVYRDHCSFQEPLGRLITENRHLDIYDYSIRGDVIWDPSEGGRELKKSDVFPLRRCTFMGHDAKCPNKPKEFLRKFYGDNLEPLTICRNGKWVKKSDLL